MAQYRISRNIEASLIDFLKTSLEETPYLWENINIEKSFNRVYELSLPTICVQTQDTTYTQIQIGDNSFERTVMTIIDLFCENDGQRLDLKDTLIEILKDGCPYYEFKIAKLGRTSIVEEKTQNGRIRILKIDDTSINFAVEKDKLDIRDRYRHRLTLTISTGKVE
jgi:hypothetical protein